MATKAQLIAQIEALQAEIAALKSTRRVVTPLNPPTTLRPVRVMSLDRAFAFRARAQLARDGSAVACQPVHIERCGKRVQAWMVF